MKKKIFKWPIMVRWLILVMKMCSEVKHQSVLVPRIGDYPGSFSEK